MTPAQTISLHYPDLHALAYSILRCKEDAEDIVQDTFLKWLSIDTRKIENTKAYLVTAVTNNCLNHLKTLRKKKEELWDNVKFGELFDKLKNAHLPSIHFDFELASAFKIIQSKLEPVERAVYILKEVFDFDYESLTKLVDKKKDHCRQLVSRAKKKLAEATDSISIESLKPGLLESFKKSVSFGHISEFVQHLKSDISESLSKKS